MLSNKKKLTVRISSGLGNQLFMFSNAFYLSEKYNLKLKIDDKSSFFQIKNLSDNRLSKLKFFKISDEYYQNVTYFDNYLKHIYRKILLILNKKNFYIEHKFKNTKKTFYKPIKLFPKNNIEISGHYECEKYFIKSKKKLQKILIPNKTYKSKYIDMLKNSNSVSIHVRTRAYYGYAYKDFSRKKKISILDQVNYIKKSISFIQSKVKNPQFFIWSDDISLVKKYFNRSSFEFIDTNDDIHDFYLFNFCKHFIVSPSSFHWMGAWLNKNRNKICTRPIYMTPSNNVDFWPSDWIKI
tara:strand:- start:422 stop:1309 length:888 start_codon:yes stop_codon:yes gene_type:complete